MRHAIRVTDHNNPITIPHFSQNLTGGTPGGEQCLTCDFGEEVCDYVSASMSTDHQYYMLRCSGPDVPTDTLYYINGTLGMESVNRIK